MKKLHRIAIKLRASAAADDPCGDLADLQEEAGWWATVHRRIPHASHARDAWDAYLDEEYGGTEPQS